MTEVKSLNTRYEEILADISRLTKFGVNLGLGRIQKLLDMLGNPERRLRVVHIGGTNGKGSTTAMCAAILQAAGYRVGMFISPHLHDYRERITINGMKIGKEAVVKHMERIKLCLDEMVKQGFEHPTEFEVSTALAFAYFAKEQVDIAVVEVGLGGEIDSTNVVTPLVSVITNVGMDHLDYLGHDLKSIAKVKAGIIKPHSVVITGVEQDEALEIIQDKAQKLGIKLWRIGEDVCYQGKWSGETEQVFDIYGLLSVYEGLKCHLIGLHQVRNAALAVTVCEVLKATYGFHIPTKAFYEGLERVRWPGRLELLSVNPKILLDGAHNVDGARALAGALPLYDRKKLILCIGMLADKEREKVVDILVPHADEIVVTRPNSPRVGDWQTLARMIARYGRPVSMIEDPKAAVLSVLRRMKMGDMLCVTGSLYMLADARAALLDALEHRYC